MVNGVFIFPTTNVLRFVQTGGLIDDDGNSFAYKYDMQTFDNRLLKDEIWGNGQKIYEYAQKFAVGKPILIQFTTNWALSNLTCKLYDATDTQVGSDYEITLAYAYEDGTGKSTFEILIDTTHLALQKYYFKITGSNTTIEFTSEVIEVGLFAGYPYLQWQNSDRDGIIYNENGQTIFGFNIEAFLTPIPKSEKTTYAGFSFQDEMLLSVSKRGLLLKTDPIPRYLTEILEIAFDHDIVKLNGVQYVAPEVASITQIEDSNLYDFEIEINDVKFEDYTLLQEIAGVVLTNQQLQDFDDTDLQDYDNTDLEGLQ